MASTYSTNLALDLMANGDQSGTWGTTNNTNLGTLIEQAISGYVTQAITDGSGANTTITIPNGATGVARNMFIEMTGALTFSTTSLIVPANKKMYFIFNNTSGGFAVTVKVSGQTGVLVPNGKKVILTSNGTDIVEAHTAIVGNATMGGTLGITGTTTAAAINASGTVAMAGAATIGTTLAVTGTTTAAAINASGLVAMAAAATIGTTLAVTGTTTAAAINASGLVTGNAGLKINLDANSFQLVGKFQNNNAGTGTSAVVLSSDSTYYKAGLALQRADANGAGTLYLLNRASNDAANVAITDVVMQFSQAGAATIPGTLKVGAVGLGGSTPQAGVGLYSAVAYLTGNNQYGILWDSTLSGTSSSQVFAGTVQAAAATTITNGYGLSIGSATLGAGAAITTNYGIKIENQTVGGTNYAIYTGTGAVRLGDTLSVSGTSTMAAINASGVLTVTVNDNINTLVRSANTNNALWSFNTTLGTPDFVIGLRGTSDSDFHIFSYGNTADALKITRATGAVTIPGATTIGAASAGVGTLTINNATQPTIYLAKTNATAATWQIYNNGNLGFYDGTNYALYFTGAGNSVFGGTILLSGTSATARVNPATDNVGYVGEATSRWQAIYAVNGTIQTSDGREKNAIEDSNLGLSFVQSLRPVSYKWNIGENIVTYDEDKNMVVTPRAGVRLHYGFIAQEVQAAIPEGVDFGGFVQEPDNGTMSLRYHEFIGPMVKAIQELAADFQSYKSSHP